MAYSEKVIEHYENPRNVGTLDKNDDAVGTGLVGGQQGAGDRLGDPVLQLEDVGAIAVEPAGPHVRAGRLIQAHFRVLREATFEELVERFEREEAQRQRESEESPEHARAKALVAAALADQAVHRLVEAGDGLPRAAVAGRGHAGRDGDDGVYSVEELNA